MDYDEYHDCGCTCHMGNPPCSHCMNSCGACLGYFDTEAGRCADCGWDPELETMEYDMSNELNKYENLVALLNEAITTIEVTFEDGQKKYMYKAAKELADTLTKGDKVVVEARGELMIVTVAAVHKEVQISPDSTVKYKWAYSKIDIEGAENLRKLEVANAERFVVQHRQAVRARFIAEQGVDDIKLLASLPIEE